jgi:aminopeptidase N
VVRRVPVAARAVQDLYIQADQRPLTVVLDPRGGILKTLDFPKPAAEWVLQLTRSKPLPARLEAIRALGALGGEEAVAALGRALRDDPFYDIRKEAARALGQTPKDPALAPLRAALADADSRVRAAVVESLAAFSEHAELIPELARLLTTDDSFHVRARAAAALGELGKKAAGKAGGPAAARAKGKAAGPGSGGGEAKPHREEISGALFAALSQDSFHELVRGSALRALAKVDPDRAWEPARRLARYGAPIDGRGDALDALVTIAEQEPARKDEVRKLLEGYLDDPYYSLEEHAFQSLGRLGDPAALPAIARRSRLESDSRQKRNADKATERIEAKQAQGREDQALRDRVEQLERETEVLKEQVRQGEEKKGAGAGPP